MNNEKTYTQSPITNFFPKKVQSIYSCKRKATKILEQLKKVNPKPNVDIFKVFNPFISDISYIFFPYHLRLTLQAYFNQYCHNNSLPDNTPITRGLLLDFLANCDGYPSWETFQFHNLNNSIHQKTYVFTYTPCLNDTLLGGCRVHVFEDNKEPDKGCELFNPSKLFNRSSIGYSWGYKGSSVRELATALLYSIDQNLLCHIPFLIDEFLTEFPNGKTVDYIITENEVRKFLTFADKS